MTEGKISHLFEQFKSELHGAKKYLKCAWKYKKLEKSMWAEEYYQLACNELNHAGVIWKIMLEEIENCEHPEKYAVLKEMGAASYAETEQLIKSYKM